MRDTSLPLVALNFSFLGGANEDPEGKPGTGYMVSSMLDEGAGELDSRGFQQQLEENAVELRFSVTHDYFHGSIKLLRERQDQSFELLRLALNEAKFEDDCHRPRAPRRFSQRFAARPPTRARSPGGPGGTPPSPAIPTRVRTTAR